jgi:hypothetical protein
MQQCRLFLFSFPARGQLAFPNPTCSKKAVELTQCNARPHAQERRKYWLTLSIPHDPLHFFIARPHRSGNGFWGERRDGQGKSS